MKTREIAVGVALAVLVAAPAAADDRPPYSSEVLRSPQAPDYESEAETKIEGITGPATKSMSRKAAGQAEAKQTEQAGTDAGTHETSGTDDRPPYSSEVLRSPQAPDYESKGETRIEGLSGPATESASRKAAGQAERKYEEKGGPDPSGLKGPATAGESRATP